MALKVTFDQSAEPSRIGESENPFLFDLSTMVGSDGRSGNMDVQSHAQIQNQSSVSGCDQTMLTAIPDISTMAAKLNLPKSIIDRANLLFKQVNNQRTMKGRPKDPIMSACLYTVCRQEGVPKTFKDIRAISKASKKQIGRCFNTISKTLEASCDLISSGDFMLRFCSKLSLPTNVQCAATCIWKKVMELDLVTVQSRLSVATASIYLASQASGTKKSLKEIGDVCGVADDDTIRQAYQQMIGRARELFPTDFVFDTHIENLPNS